VRLQSYDCEYLAAGGKTDMAEMLRKRTREIPAKLIARPLGATTESD
jgi:hypothetical protein